MISSDALAHAARQVEHLRGVVVSTRASGRLVASWRRHDETWDAAAAAGELASWAVGVPVSLLGSGDPTVVVEHDGGTLVVRGVGDSAVGVLFDAHAPLGMARLYAGRVVGMLRDAGFGAEVTEIRDSAAHPAVAASSPSAPGPSDDRATRDLSSDVRPAVSDQHLTMLDETPAHDDALIDDDAFFDDAADETADASHQASDAASPFESSDDAQDTAAEPEPWSTDPAALLDSDAFRDSDSYEAAPQVDDDEPDATDDGASSYALDADGAWADESEAAAELDVPELDEPELDEPDLDEPSAYAIDDEVAFDDDDEPPALTEHDVDMDVDVEPASDTFGRVDPAAFDDARIDTGAEPVLPSDDPFAIEPPQPPAPALQAPLKPLALSAVEEPKGPPPIPRDPPTIPIPNDVLDASRLAARPEPEAEDDDVSAHDRETVPMKPFAVDRLERLKRVRDEVQHQMTPQPVDAASLGDTAAAEIRHLLASLTASAPDAELALLRVAVRARVARETLDVPEQLERDEINRVRSAAQVVADANG